MNILMIAILIKSARFILFFSLWSSGHAVSAKDFQSFEHDPKQAKKLLREGKYAIGLGGDVVSTKTKLFQGNSDYVYCTIHFSSFFVLVC